MIIQIACYICRPIKINNKLVDLSDGVSDTSSPIPGCSRDSPCARSLSSNLCSNNGACMSSWASTPVTVCACNEGFTGSSCHTSKLYNKSCAVLWV